MARILKQENQVVGANNVPAAPAAPMVRSTQSGSMVGQSAATSFKAPVQSPPPKVTPKQPTSGNPASYGFDNRDDPRAGDAEYWSNVAIINNEFSREMGSALIAQEQADMEFDRAKTDLRSDREMARRSLAESMLGQGNMYSGSHRKQQTLGDIDYIQQFGRLNDDFALANRQRQFDRDDLERRLGPVGSEIMELQRQATERKAKAALDENANNDPELKSPGVKERLRSRNKQLKAQGKRIERLKKQRDATTNPHARRRLENQIDRLRDKRIRGARQQKVLKYAVKHGVTGAQAKQTFNKGRLSFVNDALSDVNGTIDRLKAKRDKYKKGSSAFSKLNDRVFDAQAKRKRLLAKQAKLKNKVGGGNG